VLLAAEGARCRRSRVPMARQGDGDAHADCKDTRDSPRLRDPQVAQGPLSHGRASLQ
jgi:hypothetical protein